MTKNNKTENAMQDCEVLVGLLRGGIPLNEAADAVGQTYAQAIYKLNKFGMSALSIRASGDRVKDGNVGPILIALDMMIEGATPEVVFQSTGITVKQIKLRIEEMASYE